MHAFVHSRHNIMGGCAGERADVHIHICKHCLNCPVVEDGDKWT